MIVQTSNPAAKFVGWHRSSKRSPWRAIVEGQSEAETLNRLLDAAVGGDKTVLPAGADPNHQPRPR